MKVPIAKIRPNPFQVRKHVDRAAINALAAEIKTLGFWGSLRARKVDGEYELCFGHRRLEALKILKWKEVDIEIVKLSDDDMASYALVENLQREGLTDIEKADGIQRLMERFNPNGNEKIPDVRNRVAELLGLSVTRLYELLQVKTLSKRSQSLIAKKEIAGGTSIRAHQLGGEAMVETAARHRLGYHTIGKMQAELAAIAEPPIRERVRKAVVAGKVRDPESIREEVRKVSRQVAERTGTRPPPDLRVVIRAWTKTMHAWAKQLDHVEPYRNYIDEDEDTAEAFRAAIRELTDKLKRFL